MTRDALVRYKTAVEVKKKEIESRSRTLDRIAVEREPDALDEVQLAADRNVAITALDRDAFVLGQIRSALERIRTGTYGTCLNCGDEIAPARLAAVPWAGFCIRCQEATDLERQMRARGGGEDVVDEAA